MSSADYYLTNQGTGAISTYRVNFTDTDIQIYEADGITPNATGWVSSPWWVGVFDGLLYVVSDSIAGAVALPSEVVITITDDGLLLYYGFTSVVIGVTDVSIGWWQDPITSTAWWRSSVSSVGWWINSRSSIGLWPIKYSTGWWNAPRTSIGRWKDNR